MNRCKLTLQEVTELREQGLSYRKIGAKAGVSGQYIQQLLAPAAQREYQRTPAQREYQRTPAQREYRREYQRTPAQREYQREYQRTPARREYQREYRRHLYHKKIDKVFDDCPRCTKVS